MIAAGGMGGSIRAPDGTQLATFIQNSPISCLEVLSHGRFVVGTAHGSGMIRDADGTEMRPLIHDFGHITCVAVLSTGRFVTGHAGGYVCLFSEQEGVTPVFSKWMAPYTTEAIS